MLRWQRFNSAVAGALFAAIWPAVDLPTGTEVAAVRADYVGFTIPNEFVVGFGLDYAERYRNLPDVGVLSLGTVEKSAAKAG